MRDVNEGRMSESEACHMVRDVKLFLEGRLVTINTKDGEETHKVLFEKSMNERRQKVNYTIRQDEAVGRLEGTSLFSHMTWIRSHVITTISVDLLIPPLSSELGLVFSPLGPVGYRLVGSAKL